MEFRPMPICAVACVFTAIAAYYQTDYIPVIFIFSIALFVLLCILRKAEALLPILLVVVMVISVFVVLDKIETLETYEGERFNEFVEVVEEPQRTEYGYSAVVRTTGGFLPEGSKILVYYGNEKLHTGDSAVVEMKLKFLDEYKSYYYSQGIYMCANVYDVYCIGTVKSLVVPQRVRDYIKDTLYANLSKGSAATLNALTVGERSGFTDKFELAVRRAGVSHVMVVSGMHLSIIMSGVFVIMRQITHNEFLRAVAVVTVALLLTVLCGFTMSILRAAITYIIMAIAPVLNREGDPLNALGLAVAIMLIQSPFSVFSVSFQLSVLSTFGILILAPVIVNEIKYRIDGKCRFISKALSPVVVTLSATLLTMPVVIYQFEEISLIAVLSNILITYTVTAALLVASLALIIKLLPIISAAAKPLFTVAEFLTQYINYVIIGLGKESAAVALPKFTAFLFVLLAAAILLLINVYLNYRMNKSKPKERRYACNF